MIQGVWCLCLPGRGDIWPIRTHKYQPKGNYCNNTTSPARPGIKWHASSINQFFFKCFGFLKLSGAVTHHVFVVCWSHTSKEKQQIGVFFPALAFVVIKKTPTMTLFILWINSVKITRIAGISGGVFHFHLTVLKTGDIEHQKPG